MMANLIKVLYFTSKDFDEQHLLEMGIDLDGERQLIALEIYSDGTNKYVVIKEGVVDYILKGE